MYLKQGKADLAIPLLKHYAEIIENLNFTIVLWKVKAWYYLGQAYEMNGDKPEAISAYEKFLDIWKDADTELDCIKDARARLSRLTS